MAPPLQCHLLSLLTMQYFLLRVCWNTAVILLLVLWSRITSLLSNSQFSADIQINVCVRLHECRVYLGTSGLCLNLYFYLSMLCSSTAVTGYILEYVCCRDCLQVILLLFCQFLKSICVNQIWSIITMKMCKLIAPIYL